MSDKFMQRYLQAQKLAHDLRTHHPYVSQDSALIMAFIHVESNEEKAKKQLQNAPALSDEEVQQITKWVRSNFFHPMSMAEIYTSATRRQFLLSKAKATHAILAAEGITRTKKNGRVRYGKANSTPDPVVWASD